MFNFSSIFSMIDEDLLERIKIWHVLGGLLSGFFITVIFTSAMFMYFPKYITYLELEDMRRTILWTETHNRAAMIIGPTLDKYPEYSKFMLYSFNDDLESIEMEK